MLCRQYSSLLYMVPVHLYLTSHFSFAMFCEDLCKNLHAQHSTHTNTRVRTNTHTQTHSHMQSHTRACDTFFRCIFTTQSVEKISRWIHILLCMIVTCATSAVVLWLAVVSSINQKQNVCSSCHKVHTNKIAQICIPSHLPFTLHCQVSSPCYTRLKHLKHQICISRNYLRLSV